MKPFTAIAVFVFSLISLLHLFRIFFGWKITVDGLVVPMWVSIPGFVVAAGLAFMVWREAHK